MADEKKIIEIKVELTEGVKEIGRLVGMIDKLNAAQKSNTKQTDEQRTEYAKNSVALREYRSQLSTMVRETRNEIKTTNEKIGYIQQLKAQVSNLTLEYERLTQAELQGDKGAQVLTNLKSKREELSKLEQAYGNYTRNVGNYSSATNMLALNLGQVMKEIPNFAISARIGIMSLTNNLPMLAEAFKAVRIEQQQMLAQGKAVIPMWKLLTQSIFGLTGIVSIASALLFAFSDDILRFFTSTTKADDAVKKFNKSLKDGEGVYSTSANEINEIETQLRLASKGFLDADDVLRTYNESLGGTFGAANDLSGALANIVKYKSTYINAMVEMSAAQLIFEESTRKASEALALERQGKPSFWSNLKTVANTIYESFDITQWGIMSLPNTLSKIANTSSITYQNYLNEISSLRRESFADMQSYQKEIDKIAEKYKDEPFFAAMFGIKPGKQENETTSTDYKDTPAWKEFSARYDAMKEMQEMLDTLEQSALSVSGSITKENTKLFDDLYKKATEIVPKISVFSKELNDEIRKQAEDDSANWTEMQRKRAQDAVYYADLQLATIEANGQASFQARLNLLEAEKQAEINNAIETRRSVADIEAYYAARRNQIQQEEINATISATAGLMGAISSLWEESTTEHKIFATAEAVMNTWLGVTNALAQTQGGIIAQIAGAGAALVSGLAAVRKIWAVKVDSPNVGSAGGSVGSAPKQQPDLTSKMGSPLNGAVSSASAFGGSSGIASAPATSIATGNNSMMQVMQNMPAPIVTVKDIEIAQKRVHVVDSISKI